MSKQTVMKNESGFFAPTVMFKTRLAQFFVPTRLLAFALVALLFHLQGHGQSLTVYSSVSCQVSVRIYWSNTACPGTPPFSAPTCNNITSATSPITINPPAGYTKVGKVEFWCGSPNGCPSPSGPFITWPGCGVGIPTQYLNCCGQNLDIQGSVEKRMFRIDQ